MGNFVEFGPILLKVDGSQVPNNFTWTTEYNIVFVDQPIGAGFGYAAKKEEIPTNED